MREMHLFAGAGGGILGGMLLGHVPVCAVEIDKYCRRVLQARQDDGLLPPFPIYEDVKTFDGQPWRGLVDVVAGGFPCQPFSCAGKQLGTADPRHLWPEMARIIKEVRPTYVFAENVALAAFEEPWRDLRRLGYRVPPAICVSASDVGAPHLRKRWWLLATDAERIQLRNKPGRELGASGQGAPVVKHDGQAPAVADTTGAQDHQKRGNRQCGRQAMGWNQQTTQRKDKEADHNCASRCSRSSHTHADGTRLERHRHRPSGTSKEHTAIGDSCWWETQPNVGRVAHGVASRVDRLKALGNGQVPLTAATAWQLLIEADA